MRNSLNKFIMVLCILLVCMPAHAWKIEVKNTTERILEAQGEMAAAISERKHTDWKRIMPDQTITFDTGVREVKGLNVRFPIDEDMKKYNYPAIEGNLLEESRKMGMAINPKYVITFVVTPDKSGSSETFFLLRKPKPPFYPGGIMNESKPVHFGSNVPPVTFDGKQTVNGFDRWEGSDDTLYEQAHYLMAHNAHSSTKYGYIIDPQQDLSITDLLKYGARGFMLDTYLFKNDIYLMHGSPVATVALLKPLQQPDKLKTRMDEIVDFMKRYPQVVITISFEDYVEKDVAKLDEILKSYEELIFTPTDFANLKNKWPTLGWMRSANKRLILFKSSSDKSQYMFGNELAYHIENQYSETDKTALASERGGSKRYTKTNRKLYYFNFFGKFNISADYDALKKSYKSTLQEAINHVLENGLDGKFKGQKPNFIVTDFSEWGEGLEIVHDWNLPHTGTKNQ